MTSTARRNATPPKNPKLFQPGVSGNPGGLPTWQREMKALMREHTAAAVQVVVDTMHKAKSDKDRLSAAQYIIDQTCGKAVQKIGTDDDAPAGTLVLTWATPAPTA